MPDQYEEITLSLSELIEGWFHQNFPEQKVYPQQTSDLVNSVFDFFAFQKDSQPIVFEKPPLKPHED